MNNLQDELAWLNHRLDNKLEEWRNLHRLHGRFNAFLIYCLLALIAVSAYPACVVGNEKMHKNYIIMASFMAAGSLLAFSLLKWRLYHRLLTKGHDDKAQIDRRHITSTLDNHLLKECQDNFINLLRVERSFPFSDQLKKTCAKKLSHIRLRIAQMIKSVRLHVKKIVESCDRVKKLEEKVEKLQEDVEKLKQQIGQITPEKPKGQ
jgi:peptidoglycan hydrolase CwlO-like protein